MSGTRRPSSAVALGLCGLLLAGVGLGAVAGTASADPAVDVTATTSPTADVTPTASPEATPTDASTLGTDAQDADTATYIVTTASDARTDVAQTISEAGGVIVAEFDKAISGLSAELTTEQADALAQVDGVLDVERDQAMSIQDNDLVGSSALVPDTGCTTTAFPRGDDLSSASTALGFSVNWFGTSYSRIYVNNNGGIVFDDGNGAFPDYLVNLNTTNRPIVMPLGTDIDTRNTATSTVTYGSMVDPIGGRSGGFCVQWKNVGHYNASAPYYAAQLLVIPRPDRGTGDVDLIFNYENIDNAAAAYAIEIGYADPANRSNSLRVSGSGVAPTQFRNAGTASRVNGQLDGAGYTARSGRWVYPIHSTVAPSPTPTPTPTPTATAAPCSMTVPAGTQGCATWGLDRIDQRALPLNQEYTAANTGSGVNVYVVDTGVLATHTELAGRVTTGYTAIGGTSTDCNGHGTHVAGTIAGTTYGVAKQATITPVRVLGCDGSGTTSSVLTGINWAIGDHAANQPAVMNLSIGGGYSKSLNDAIDAAVADGITVVVAAGNSNDDVAYYSPASAASAITVGAMTSTDARASYSNYGAGVDLFAPGSSITSAYYTSTTALATLSGTSMASPHVAGAAALVLSQQPTATPATVTSAITDATTPNIVTSASSTNNRLLYARAFTTSNASPSPSPSAQPSGQSSSSSSSGSSSGGSSSGGSASGGGSSSGSSSGGAGGGSMHEITSVRPASGSTAGGNTVALVGYGFTGASQVLVGGVPASYTVVNDAHIDVVMPPHAVAGPVDVSVVLSATIGRAFAAGGYVYVAEAAPATAPEADATVPVAPTKPDVVGILSTPVNATVIKPAAVTRLANGKARVRVTLASGAAGKRVTLTHAGRTVARGTVGPTGVVAFTIPPKTGYYRVSIAGAPAASKPFPVRIR